MERLMVTCSRKTVPAADPNSRCARAIEFQILRIATNDRKRMNDHPIPEHHMFGYDRIRHDLAIRAQRGADSTMAVG